MDKCHGRQSVVCSLYLNIHEDPNDLQEKLPISIHDANPDLLFGNGEQSRTIQLVMGSDIYKTIKYLTVNGLVEKKTSKKLCEK